MKDHVILLINVSSSTPLALCSTTPSQAGRGDLFLPDTKKIGVGLVTVIATLSRKQTHSEGQCRWCSAVYYAGGPKAESPLSQGPHPAFVKIFYTPSVRVQTHRPKFLETYKGRVNTITITPSFMCYVFKQLIISKPAVTFQPVNNR